jgi:hypothetical protein
MANMAMRQQTFISFMCCPEWRGLLTSPPPPVNLIFNDIQKSVQSLQYIILTSYNAKKELRTFTELIL